jgi:hypothetical protein
VSGGAAGIGRALLQSSDSLASVRAPSPLDVRVRRHNMVPDLREMMAAPRSSALPKTPAALSAGSGHGEAAPRCRSGAHTDGLAVGRRTYRTRTPMAAPTCARLDMIGAPRPVRPQLYQDDGGGERRRPGRRTPLPSDVPRRPGTEWLGWEQWQRWAKQPSLRPTSPEMLAQGRQFRELEQRWPSGQSLVPEWGGPCTVPPLALPRPTSVCSGIGVTRVQDTMMDVFKGDALRHDARTPRTSGFDHRPASQYELATREGPARACTARGVGAPALNWRPVALGAYADPFWAGPSGAGEADIAAAAARRRQYEEEGRKRWSDRHRPPPAPPRAAPTTSQPSRDDGSEPTVGVVPTVKEVVQTDIQYSGLLLEVVAGKHLLAMDMCGKSDPFCEIEFDGQCLRTTTKKNTLAPQWAEEFALPLGEKSEVTLSIYDEDFAGTLFGLRSARYARLSSIPSLCR